MKDFMITSESVTAGHPDKLCDQISDAIVDAYLTAGASDDVTAECAIATGVIFLSVRAARELPFDAAAIARQVMHGAGYEAAPGAQGPTVLLDSTLMPQSGTIAANGVARQMVTAFGHACGHTDAHMPYAIWSAHRLTVALDLARVEGRIPWLDADAQAQVAVAFTGRQPQAIRAVAITATGSDAPSEAEVREALGREVVAPAFAGAPLVPDDDTRFVFAAVRRQGGPILHSGLTGRKTTDDTYGGFVRQSSAALSGKSPARIDRIAAYAARQAARAAVVAGLAGECELQLSYIVGDAGPASVEVDTFGSGTRPDARISARLREVFDFRVDAIAERMGLWQLPAARGGRFFRDFATYGHMGRDDLAPPWEDTGLAASLA